MTNYKKFKSILIKKELIYRGSFETEEDFETCIKGLFTNNYFFAEYSLERIDAFGSDAEEAMKWIKLCVRQYDELNDLRPKPSLIEKLRLSLRAHGMSDKSIMLLILNKLKK